MLRALFDYAKLGFYNWFSKMREDAFKYDRLTYAVLFFSLVTVTEVVPIVMYLYNLGYIMSNRAALEPKQIEQHSTPRVR